MSQTPPPPGQYPPQYQPQYPQQYQQQGYAPPTMPPPNWQAAQAPRTKSKGPMLIGIVVVVVLIGAAVGYFVSSSGKDSDLGSSGAPVTVPPPVAPAQPGSGGNATGVTLPGPSVDDPVVTTAAPQTTAAPNPPSGGGGITPTGVGSTVPLAGGVGIAVPAGWEIYSQSENTVEYGTAGGSVFVVIASGYSDASSPITTYWGDLGSLVSNLDVTQPETFTPLSGNFVDTRTAYYGGILSSSQSGSSPVLGWVISGLRSDGVVVLLDLMWLDDGSGSVPTDFTAGIATLLQSSTFG